MSASLTHGHPQWYGAETYRVFLCSGSVANNNCGSYRVSIQSVGACPDCTPRGAVAVSEINFNFILTFVV